MSVSTTTETYTFEAIIRHGVAADLLRLREMSGQSLEDVIKILGWPDRNKLSRLERGADEKNINVAYYQQVMQYFLVAVPRNVRGSHPLEEMTGRQALDSIKVPSENGASPMLHEYLTWIAALSSVGALVENYPGLALCEYLHRLGVED